VQSWANSRASEGTLSENPDEIIVLIDPDMIFLAPITLEPIAKENLLIRTKPQVDGGNVVTRGHPVAAFYPIGVPWAKGGFFNQKWKPMLDADFGGKEFNEAVCGFGSPCLEIDQTSGWNSYSLGPPYVLTLFLHTVVLATEASRAAAPNGVALMSETPSPRNPAAAGI
jgi:hypothetical protein